jgi:phage terminase large subunit-like protein
MLSPEVKDYLAKRGYDITNVPPPAFQTPEPRNVKGAVFDGARADRVIAFLRLLRHTQGKWAGRPLEPDAWQVAYLIGPTFSWVAPNDDGDLVRIIRKLYIDLPRKQGKTTLAAGLALYLAFGDKEPAAQVLAVAGTKDQAGAAYEPARAVAAASPAFKQAGIKAGAGKIIKPDGSWFSAFGSVGDFLHGKNVHGAVVDELHIHKDGKLLEAVETGTVSRTQPLLVIITTADDGRQESVYAQQRKMFESVANGSVKMPTLYGCVWAADIDDDISDPETWKKANPSYGISVPRSYMEMAAAKALENPTDLASFQRLHLGIRTKQTTKFIRMEHWNRNASIVDEHTLKGKEAYGGLDLASVSDLTAFSLVFPDISGGYDCLFRIWAPEGAIPSLDTRTHGMASVWAKQGIIQTTPGDVCDYDYVTKQILADCNTFDVKEIAYDKWNAQMLVNELNKELKPEILVQFIQGIKSFTGPTKELARLSAKGTAENPMIRHGGNPCVRWQMDNLAVDTDAAANVKPAKDKAGDKIDSIVALIMALDRAMNRKPVRRSAYADDDFVMFA